MKKLTIIFAALLPLLLTSTAAAERAVVPVRSAKITAARVDATLNPPQVFGYAQGDVVSEADRNPEDADKVLRNLVLGAKSGFDRVYVSYTETQGVCKVVGFVDVTNPQGDNYGRRHKAAVDGLVNRVIAKLDGKQPTQRFDQNTDRLFKNADDWLMAKRRGNAAYVRFWTDEDAAPYSMIMVSAEYGTALAGFEMANFEDCVAERDAADMASF